MMTFYYNFETAYVVSKHCYLSSIILLLCHVYSYRFFQQLSSYDILSTFLMYERQRSVQSPWYSYISMLPQTYSTPVYWSSEALLSLPADILEEARLLLKKVAKNFRRLQDLFNHVETTLAESVGAFSLSSFKWAWTSVSTRCVYMRPSNFAVGSTQDNCIALAPLLDLLNHSPNVEVISLFCEIVNSC